MLRLNTNYDYHELFLKYNNLNITIDAIHGISNVITSGVTVSFGHGIVQFTDTDYLFDIFKLFFSFLVYFLYDYFCFHICLQ